MNGYNPWGFGSGFPFPIMYPPPPGYGAHNQWPAWMMPPQQGPSPGRGRGRRSRGGGRGFIKDPIRDMEQAIYTAEATRTALDQLIERHKKKEEKKPEGKYKEVFQTIGAVFLLGPPILAAYALTMFGIFMIVWKLAGN
jgi:hypothetical protein